MTNTEIAIGLRAWARGSFTLEAATEVLIRSPRGRLLRGPWIRDTEVDGCLWFDPEYADEFAAPLSSGERRLLALAGSLAEDHQAVPLGNILAGLDRETVTVVLAAISHAAGSHQHARLVEDPEGRWVREDGPSLRLERLPSLYPWPDTNSDTDSNSNSDREGGAA